MILLGGTKGTENGIDGHIDITLFAKDILDVAMIYQVLDDILGQVEADKISIRDQLPDRSDLEV